MSTRTHIRVTSFIGILLMSTLALSSCRGDGVLSSHKMVVVLTDLHRMDGMLQVKNYKYGADTDEAAYYDAVLNKHNVTRAEFDSSLVWYTQHPQRFNKLYPRVISRLEAEHALFEDESAQQKAFREKRREHFELFTYELAIHSVQHGYPLTDYHLPPIDTLDVTIPLTIRIEEREDE